MRDADAYLRFLTTRPEVAVVGGAQIAIARDQRAISLGIARALNNRWSMGGSRYRRGVSSGESDTVYLGAFRRLELADEGGWNEELVHEVTAILDEAAQRIERAK